MLNFTSKTYSLKWEILIFSNKISIHLSKPERKFTADMTYGMLASGSCLLTDIERKNIYLVLVYGITEHPMMLATNKKSVQKRML